MQKWEYLEVEVTYHRVYKVSGEDLKPHVDFRVYANKLGEQGWEMCEIAGSGSEGRFTAYFRRSLA